MSIGTFKEFPFLSLAHVYFWIKDELELWSKLETEHLSGEPNFDLMAAGINELDKFGLKNVIDSIALKWRMKEDEVWSKTYGWIFDEQWKSVIESRIQKKLAKQSKR